MSNHYRTISSSFKRPKLDNNSSEELIVTGTGPSIVLTPDNSTAPPTRHALELIISAKGWPHIWFHNIFILNCNPAGC